MIYLYVVTNCQSCKKAMKWFDDEKIEYKLINLLDGSLSKEDIFRMLINSENGFDDIISKRSVAYQQAKINFDEIKTSELISFIINNPTVLRRPIIVSKDILQVGYNADQIRAFIPKERRKLDFHGKECLLDPSKCGFIDSTNKTFDAIKKS